MSKKVYYDDTNKHGLTGSKYVYVDENGTPLNRELLSEYDLTNPIYYSDSSKDPRRGNAFKGNDTLNIKSDLEEIKLKREDERIRNIHKGSEYAKLAGINLGGAAVAGGIAAAPAWIATNIIAPSLLGKLWDNGQRALTGTTTTEQVSNYLLNRGVNPSVAEFTGSLTNPGYWFNAGTGKITQPLTRRIAGVPFEQQATERAILLSTNLALNSGYLVIKKPLGLLFFESLPYDLINKGVTTYYDTKNKIKLFVRSDPFSYRSYKIPRLRALARANPRITVENVVLPDNIIANSTENPIDLTLSRFNHNYNTTRPFFTPKYSGDPNNITFKPYFSTGDIRDIFINKGYSKFKATLKTPIKWLQWNLDPGLSLTGLNTIHINKPFLNTLGLDKNSTIAHEMTHALDTRRYAEILSRSVNPQLNRPYPTGFSYSHMSPSIKRYFQSNYNTELAARGSLIKNYFGLKADEPITADMLKYAAKHYVEDTGTNNNMNLFFSGIIDWDAAAKWLSENAL